MRPRRGPRRLSRQREPQADAAAARAEQRLEEPREVVGRDTPEAVVAHGELDGAAGRAQAETSRPPRALAQAIACTALETRLMSTPRRRRRASPCTARAGRELDGHRHVRLARHRREGLMDQRRKVHRR
ncbi:MAG: hypothetical protein U0325_35810 [Polyangiales bacterium]